MSMTNEQLVARIRAGEDEAKNMLELWEQNKGFIYKLAVKHQGYAELEDLLQEGYLGLCAAVQHYEPDKSVPFLTYAAFWIKQGIQRYISNCCSSVRIPEYAKNKVQQYKKMVDEYRKWYGKNPTDLEMQSFLGVSREKLETIKKNTVAVNIRSLDECISGEGEDFTLSDTVASACDVEDEVISILDTAAMKEALWSAVDALPDHMPEVLRGRYQDRMTLKEVGESLGVSDTHIIRIEREALKKLKLPRRNRTFKGYYEEYIGSSTVRHVGVTEFKRTWLSSTELQALKEVDCM